MDIQTVLVGVGLLASTGVAYGICCSIRNAARQAAHDAEEFFQFGEPLPPVFPAAPAAANSNWPGLSDDQRNVIMEMSRETGWTAAVISDRTGLTVARISAARRALAEMQLAKFGPLYDEDSGAVCGSGYTLTSAGEAIKAALYQRLADGLAA